MPLFVPLIPLAVTVAAGTGLGIIIKEALRDHNDSPIKPVKTKKKADSTDESGSSFDSEPDSGSDSVCDSHPDSGNDSVFDSDLAKSLERKDKISTQSDSPPLKEEFGNGKHSVYDDKIDPPIRPL